MQSVKLSTKGVTLWPYVREQFPRDALYNLWKLMDKEGATRSVFWRDHEHAGDLTTFIHYFTLPDRDGPRLLYVGQENATNDIVGLWWFEDVVPDHRAFVGLWVRRKWWATDEANGLTDLVLNHGFQFFNFQTIWGHTPWIAAVAHGTRHKFKEVALLPAFEMDIGGKPRDIYYVKLNREDFYGQEITKNQSITSGTSTSADQPRAA